MNFTTHNNFNLDIAAWGSAQLQNITVLLDSVITEFYSNLIVSKVSVKTVLVLNSSTRNPPINHPMIIPSGNDVWIYLDTKDLFWSQYSYQFSHELCHYVIDADFLPRNGKFGWFEESLCELASIYTLNKMSVTWQSNPPYDNWKDFRIALSDYASEIISRPGNKITETLKDWLTNNLSDLFKDRYKREKNLIVAVSMMPIFVTTPDLWKSIQFLKDINVTDDMTFEQYLLDWQKLIPQYLSANFDSIINLFL